MVVVRGSQMERSRRITLASADKAGFLSPNVRRSAITAPKPNSAQLLVSDVDQTHNSDNSFQ